jgi:hypothetical protein
LNQNSDRTEVWEGAVHAADTTAAVLAAFVPVSGFAIGRTTMRSTSLGGQIGPIKRSSASRCCGRDRGRRSTTHAQDAPVDLPAHRPNYGVGYARRPVRVAQSTYTVMCGLSDTPPGTPRWDAPPSSDRGQQQTEGSRV